MYRRMIVQPSKQLTAVSNSITKPRLLNRAVGLRASGRSFTSSAARTSSHRIADTREVQRYTAMPLEVTSPPVSATEITPQDEQPNTTLQQTPSPTEDDTAEDNAYSDYNQGMNGDDESQVLIEKWRPAVGAIMQATHEAFALSPHNSSPPGHEPSRDEFRKYWWAVFTRLLERVETDSTIPNQLTSPPVTRFIVKLFDERDLLGCPCCLPQVPPSIKLRNDQGVGKADLVRGLRDYLFGETVPSIYAEGEEDAEEPTVETALLYSADWMSGGSDEHGESISYYNKVPQVFMYCCPADQYQAKRETRGQKEEES